MQMTEVSATFRCFGGTCAVLVSGDGADDAVAEARRRLLAWHDRFTRFEPTSELSLLNADERPEVPVSPDMARFAEAVVATAAASGGLVDATLLGAVESAGYRNDLRNPLPLALALRLAPPRGPAGPSAEARWRAIAVNRDAGTVIKPPGIALDSGGIVKGLFADMLAEELAAHESFAIDCAGDLRLGGAADLRRPVQVASPFEDRILHTFELTSGGIATSGIGRRSWLDARGRPAHHLLDPSTGRPAFTGIVQVTALAPTAVEAEMRSKSSLLSGRASAAQWLPHGGAVVLDDGTHEVVDAS